MANIGDFVGAYTIRNVASSPVNGAPDPLLQVGGQFLIGTGTYGDTPPVLTDGYFVAVGFAILDAAGQVVLATSDETGQPLQFALSESNLVWKGFFNDQPFRIYISRYDITSLGGTRTRGIYGSNVWGDPDQVGVWGADDTPPTTPSPKVEG